MSEQTSLFDTTGPPEPPAYAKDICARKHGGNEQSRRAFSADTAAIQRERVLAAIMQAGERGLTCDELAAKWGKAQNEISGRFAELKKESWIAKIGTRKTRSGNSAGVYVAL